MASAEGDCKFWVGSCASFFASAAERNFQSDLGLLKRDKRLQLRYDSWAADIKKKYGSLGR